MAKHSDKELLNAAGMDAHSLSACHLQALSSMGELFFFVLVELIHG